MIRLILTIISLVFFSALQAADGSWQQCAAIADDGKRLACYDDYAQNISPQPNPAPISREEKEAAFGLADPRQAELEELEEIHSTVIDVQRKSRGQRILTLENGQVWEQKDSYTTPTFHVGDSVTIKRGFMGAYRLKRDAGGKALQVRRREQ